MANGDHRNASQDAHHEQRAEDSAQREAADAGLDPIAAWLDAQRTLLDRWLAMPTTNAVTEEVQQWWRGIAKNASPDAQELANQLGQLGPSFVAGAGDALGPMLGELFGAPSNMANPDLNSNLNSGAMSSGFARVAMGAAPIGYFREHQQRLQTLAKALDEYRRTSQLLAEEIARVHTEALEHLAQQLQQLKSAGKPVSETRQLYDLWIASGEQAFAQRAHQERFMQLQGQAINAGLRVRVAQQGSVEYLMKQLDLPTRAEINSLHRRVQELREQVETLQASSSSSEIITGAAETVAPRTIAPETPVTAQAARVSRKSAARKPASRN